MIDYPFFLDTEFTRWRDASLISIGLVDQSGKREFYAELTDTWEIGQCSDFVRVEVLSHLQGGEFSMSAEVCRTRLKAFIEAVDVPVQLVCDLPNYDWMLFRRLMGEEWPANLSRHAYTFDPGAGGLPKRAGEAAGAARSRYYNGPGRPIHHALHDVAALRAAWEAGLDCGWWPGAPARM